MEKRSPRSWECLIGDYEAGHILVKRKFPPKTKDILDGIQMAYKPLYLHDIIFENRVPKLKKVCCFYSDDVEDLVMRLAELSLTHRILFVFGSSIYVAESEDHQTNIDAELLDGILEVF